VPAPGRDEAAAFQEIASPDFYLVTHEGACDQGRRGERCGTSLDPSGRGRTWQPSLCAILERQGAELMSVLPRVRDATRKRVTREFDSLGPEVCMADILSDLLRHNPELLDMALTWAEEAEDAERLLTAFCVFYRSLAAEMDAPLKPGALSALPSVSPETRDRILARIDRVGEETFNREAMRNLKAANPALLQMAHGVASERSNYAHAMQGFALLHEALLIQSRRDRLRPH
jgi:hypothetical protein